MGFLSSVGGMLGGAVGGMFGGPIGMQLGQMIGSSIGERVESLISQFGQGNVQSAMNNSFMSSIADCLKEAIQGSSLPQFVKDELNEAIKEAAGGGHQSTPSACQGGVDDVVGGLGVSVGKMIADMVMDEVKEQANKEKKGGEGCQKGGDNWLVALAKAMASIQSDHLNKMLDASKEMQDNVGESKESREAFIEAQGKFQAESKLFGMASEATANALKTIGDGLSSIARKQ